MSSSVELHVAYKVANAPINNFPFPHFHVEGIFPADYYAELQAKLPAASDMKPIGEVRPVRGFEDRFVLGFSDEQLAALPEDKRAFWKALHGWLVGGRFMNMMVAKFAPYVNQRFKGQGQVRVYDEALLVRDRTNYQLGPHSDAPHKLVTLLFYLPADASQRHLGTSIYVPKDPAFRCPGGPHYPHENFDRVWTMPFVPNSLFVFFKTDNSFHGVEPVQQNEHRWLLLYDIYHRLEQPPAPPPAVKFSF